MKRKVINNNGRDKAFLGAVIGGVANIAGGIISKRKQKKAQEKAYRQAQEEQTKQEGFQQAAAMTSQYANQDYVDQYKSKITLKNGGKVSMNNKYSDRIARAKKFACGGRKKANLGSTILGDIKNIGQEFQGDNLNNTINSIASGITSAVSGNGVQNPSSSNMSAADAATAQNIATNREIARKANEAKQRKTTAAKYGTRRKAMFGIGSAISGIGNMIGSATQSTDPQKEVKKSVGFTFSAPKTGIEQNSYQTNSDGTPATAMDVNTDGTQQPTNNNNNPNANNQYKDRLQAAKFGIRKRKACGGRRK